MVTPLENITSIQDLFKITCPCRGGVAIQRPLARTPSDRLARRLLQFERTQCIGRVGGNQDFLTRLKKLIETLPGIAEDRGATGASFK
jgi:hypothetical protein